MTLNAILTRARPETTGATLCSSLGCIVGEGVVGKGRKKGRRAKEGREEQEDGLFFPFPSELLIHLLPEAFRSSSHGS